MACASGNIASVFLVDYLGRRLTACLCLGGACVCALLFAAAPATGAWAIVSACIFNGISVGGWNSLDLISAELYPTEVRPARRSYMQLTNYVLSPMLLGYHLLW